MRIKIKLQPLAYPAAIPATHHQLQAFIYEMVDAVNPRLAQAVHDEGWPATLDPLSSKRFKLFVFSIPEAPRGFQFQGEEKVFSSGTVFWQISSPNAEFITSLIAGMAMKGNVRIGRTRFAVADVQIVNPPEISDEMRFIALSPLVASRAEKGTDGKLSKIYLRDEESFALAVADNLKKKFTAWSGRQSEDGEFEFAFDRDYLVKAGGFDSRKVTRTLWFIKHFSDGKQERIGIRGIQAPFWVRGNRELIEYGWETGFGEANSQGFGMAGWGNV
ncbi:MAG: CRISPR-associated endoribonuclease Cas6 [Blastocatellales bacterium]